MTTRIFKYPLFPNNRFRSTVNLPASANIRHIAVQSSVFGRGIMAWAEVVNEDHLVEREFILVSTGEGVLDRWEYMKTLEVDGGTIWHLYEIKS